MTQLYVFPLERKVCRALIKSNLRVELVPVNLGSEVGQNFNFKVKNTLELSMASVGLRDTHYYHPSFLILFPAGSQLPTNSGFLPFSFGTYGWDTLSTFWT